MYRKSSKQTRVDLFPPDTGTNSFDNDLNPKRITIFYIMNTSKKKKKRLRLLTALFANETLGTIFSNMIVFRLSVIITRESKWKVVQT